MRRPNLRGEALEVALFRFQHLLRAIFACEEVVFRLKRPKITRFASIIQLFFILLAHEAGEVGVFGAQQLDGSIQPGNSRSAIPAPHLWEICSQMKNDQGLRM